MRDTSFLLIDVRTGLNRAILSAQNCGAGGSGGAALELIAVNDLIIGAHGGINLDGEEGENGFRAGGGGSGGTLLISAGGVIVIHSTISARGGAGGKGVGLGGRGGAYVKLWTAMIGRDCPLCTTLLLILLVQSCLYVILSVRGRGVCRWWRRRRSCRRVCAIHQHRWWLLQLVRRCWRGRPAPRAAPAHPVHRPVGCVLPVQVFL